MDYLHRLDILYLPMSVQDVRMYLHRPISIYNFSDKTCLVSLPLLEGDSGIASLGSVKGVNVITINDREISRRLMHGCEQNK